MGSDLVPAVRTALRDAADPALAPGMQAYMKSELPFLGVRVPEVRRITRRLVRARAAPDGPDLLTAATTLWREATHREERYAAQALTGVRPVAGDLGALPLLQEMIVTGAWWDHVDDVSHRVGDLLAAHAEQLGPVLLGWSTGPDRWLRRASIICQLGFKERTDTELLAATIEASVDHPDFFVRKGIGWALRDYARTDPAWVRAFVAAHPGLSPLSRREALRRAGREAAPTGR